MSLSRPALSRSKIDCFGKNIKIQFLFSKDKAKFSLSESRPTYSKKNKDQVLTRLFKSTLSLPRNNPQVFEEKSSVHVTKSFLENKSQLEFYYIDNYHSSLITFITFYWFLSYFVNSHLSLDALSNNKEDIKDIR